MARIELAPEIRDDFDRIFDHLSRSKAGDASERIAEIVQAIGILEHSPLIGKPAGRGKRALVIGRRGRGYIVLYRYLEKLDCVFVLAVRSQKESGFSRTLV